MLARFKKNQALVQNGNNCGGSLSVEVVCTILKLNVSLIEVSFVLI
jgi:hypothetical protein